MTLRGFDFFSPSQREGLIEVQAEDVYLLDEVAKAGHPPVAYLKGYYMLQGATEEEAGFLSRDETEEAFRCIVKAANAELPQAMDFLEGEVNAELELSDGTVCRYGDFYEVVKPDGKKKFWPEYLLKSDGWELEFTL